jgi:hypothetical protein
MIVIDWFLLKLVLQLVTRLAEMKKNHREIKIIVENTYHTPHSSILQSGPKSIHEICFDQNPFFAISKMAKNQFLNWEKV